MKHIEISVWSEFGIVLDRRRENMKLSAMENINESLFLSSLPLASRAVTASAANNGKPWKQGPCSCSASCRRWQAGSRLRTGRTSTEVDHVPRAGGSLRHRPARVLPLGGCADWAARKLNCCVFIEDVSSGRTRRFVEVTLTAALNRAWLCIFFQAQQHERRALRPVQRHVRLEQYFKYLLKGLGTRV